MRYLLLLTLFASCNLIDVSLNSEVYKVKEGQHLFKPYIAKKIERGSVLSGSFSIPRSSWYRPIDEENDYNKITGITLNRFKPNKDAIMIAWRPTQDRRFEIATYSNRNYQHYIGYNATPASGDVYLTIDPNELVEFEIQWQEDVQTIILRYKSEEYIITSHHFRIQKEKGWIVSPWFGGNNPAPKNLSIILFIS